MIKCIKNKKHYKNMMHVHCYVTDWSFPAGQQSIHYLSTPHVRKSQKSSKNQVKKYFWKIILYFSKLGRRTWKNMQIRRTKWQHFQFCMWRSRLDQWHEHSCCYHAAITQRQQFHMYYALYKNVDNKKPNYNKNAIYPDKISAWQHDKYTGTPSWQRQTSANIFHFNMRGNECFTDTEWQMILLRRNKDFSLWTPSDILSDVHLKTPFTDLTKSRKMTLKCEPSQYGAFLVCLQAHSKTVPSFSGVKRRGRMLGASFLWAPSQKGWQRKKMKVNTLAVKLLSGHL